VKDGDSGDWKNVLSENGNLVSLRGPAGKAGEKGEDGINAADSYHIELSNDMD
jgi:hypothetical protein